MAQVTQSIYDTLKKTWKTDVQIRDAIATKYWQWSEETKSFDSLMQSKLAVNQPTTTVKPTVAPTTTIKPTVAPTTWWQTQIDNALKTWSIADVRNQLKWKVSQDQFNKIDSYLASKIPITPTTTIPTTSIKPNTNKLLSEAELQKKRDLVQQAMQKKEVENKDITKNITPDILNKSQDDLLKTKATTLWTFKTDDINKTWDNFTKSSNILKSNNQALLGLYWIKPDWTVDTENQNWLAFQIEKRRKDFDELKNKEFNKLKTLKYQAIGWQIRAAAASRWVDLSKVPFEQLVALSDQVWQAKITEVYDAKEKMINDIQTYSDNATNQINLLREKWLVSSSEAAKNIEALRQATEWQISTINKEYVNSMLWLAEWKQTETEAKKSSVLNTITTLWTSLWLSWTSLWLLNSYIWKYKTPQEAYQAIFNDLANTKSELYKSLKSQEEAAATQQEFKNKLEELKATKSWSSSNDWTKLTWSFPTLMIAADQNNNLQWWLSSIRTVEQLDTYLRALQTSNPWLWGKVIKDLWLWDKLTTTTVWDKIYWPLQESNP